MADQDTCPKCKRSYDNGLLTCPHCGHTRWGAILFIHATWLACAAIFFFVAPKIPPGTFHTIVKWTTGIVGGICLLAGISFTYTALRSKKQPGPPPEPVKSRPDATPRPAAPPQASIPRVEVQWGNPDIAAVNKAFLDKARNIFWDYDNKTNIWGILSDCAKELGGWVDGVLLDAQGNKDYDEAEYLTGDKAAACKGYDLVWPQAAAGDANFASLSCVSVYYYTNGNLAILSGSGLSSVLPASINRQMIMAACNTPIVQWVSISEIKLANLDYFSDAKIVFGQFQPLFIERVVRNFGEISEPDLTEKNPGLQRYYQGYVRAPYNHAAMRLEWTNKIDESQYSDTIHKCRVTVCYLADGRARVKSGQGFTHLTREQWSSEIVVKAVFDRAYQNPELYDEYQSHPPSW